MDDLEAEMKAHPFGHLPHLWEGPVQPAPLADPDEPMGVVPSHLKKLELGKSSSSCKVSFVTRLHRTSALQEFWCGSFEEAQVYENMAANPKVVGIKEQLTRTPYENLEGEPTYTLWDCTALMSSGAIILVSVKYDEKAKRRSYLDEVKKIASACRGSAVARAQVLSRFSFHKEARKRAREIHRARRGWDPEADRIVFEAANELGRRFTFDSLVETSRLGAAGHRAAIRLIGDGDIGKHPLDPFAADTLLWSIAA